MKVSELVSKTYDKIIIYKSGDDDFVDIFQGYKQSIPSEILQMDVAVFGSKGIGVLDIQIKS